MHITATVDARGMKCPVNWAKTKAVLENLPRRAIVEVLVDDPRSERDLPIAAEAEGHAVISIEHREGHLRIVLEK